MSSWRQPAALLDRTGIVHSDFWQNLVVNIVPRRFEKRALPNSSILDEPGSDISRSYSSGAKSCGSLVLTSRPKLMCPLRPSGLLIFSSFSEVLNDNRKSYRADGPLHISSSSKRMFQRGYKMSTKAQFCSGSNPNWRNELS